MVTLKCFGISGYHLAKFDIEIVDCVSLEDLLHELPRQVEGNLRELLLDNGKLRKGIYVLVNGKTIESLSGLETIIKKNDEVVISKILVGG